MLLFARVPLTAISVGTATLLPQDGSTVLTTPAGIATAIQEVRLLIPAGPSRKVAAPEEPRPTVAPVGRRPRRRVTALLACAVAASPEPAIETFLRREARLAAPLPVVDVAARVPSLPVRRSSRPAAATNPPTKVLARPVPSKRDGRKAAGSLVGKTTARGSTSRPI